MRKTQMMWLDSVYVRAPESRPSNPGFNSHPLRCRVRPCSCVSVTK